MKTSQLFGPMCLLLLLVVSSAFLNGCNKSQRALARGNYEEAVRRSIDRLRSSPNNNNARETLAQAYPRTVEWHTDQINQFKNSRVPFSQERVFESFRMLNNLANEIRRCPACMEVVGSPFAFIEEERLSGLAAAEERYQAGEIALIRKDDKRMAREAFEHFARCEEIVPDYKDVRRKIDEARFYATWKVVVEQIPVNSRLYELSNEFFYNQINEFLISNRRLNPFVRFYTPQEAMQENLRNPDHIIRMQFDDFVVGQTLITSNTEEVVSKDSVKVGEVTIEGRKIDVRNRVKARLTVNRKTVLSAGLLDFQIFDPNLSRVMMQEKINGEFTWVSEWGTFNGDERALTPEQRRICNQREVPPPPPQSLFVEFSRPIYSQVTNLIRRYYQNF